MTGVLGEPVTDRALLSTTIIGEGFRNAADFVLLCGCLADCFLEPFFFDPPSGVAGLRTSTVFVEDPTSTFNLGTERSPTAPFEIVRGYVSCLFRDTL